MIITDQHNSPTILRRWRSRIRLADAESYVAYVEATGLRGYAEIEGNLGGEILLRDMGDGTAEITTLSWWRSLDAISAFAGSDIQRAVYYPEDEKYLLEKPELVEHHQVLASSPRIADHGEHR